MQDNIYEYIQTVDISNHYSCLLAMSQYELAAMYPEVHYRLAPHIQSQCNAMSLVYGTSYKPTCVEIEAMVNNIYDNTKHYFDTDASLGEEQLSDYNHRHMVNILVIRELLRRRFPYYAPYPVYE